MPPDLEAIVNGMHPPGSDAPDGVWERNSDWLS